MILTKKMLDEYVFDHRIRLTKDQEKRILDHLGTEPEPYEYSEQDIYEQLRKFIIRGYFFDPNIV